MRSAPRPVMRAHCKGGMPPKKYLDFVESAPVKRVARHMAVDGDDVRKYVTIICPHCNDAFVQIPEECVVTNKASE